MTLHEHVPTQPGVTLRYTGTVYQTEILDH
jgi:hypothetical protein